MSKESDDHTIYRFLKPSAAQRPAAAFKMALVAHALVHV